MPTKKTYRSPSAKSIVSLRERAGWSQADFAAKIRVREERIRAWEAGEKKMPPELFAFMTVQAVYDMAMKEKPTGEDIRNLRVGMGWTQTDMAERMGTIARRVCGWEKEEHAPHAVIWRAARVFAALENPDHLTV